MLAFAGYAVFIGTVFVLMPPNPDEISAPMDLVNGFRVMSVVAVSVFWVSVAIILGGLWHKFRPDAENLDVRN
jgi:predicted cobalt transporter CbtA